MGELYQNYVEKCFKSGAMDFDDLLLKTNELLTRFPEVLAKYKTVFVIFWWMSTKIPITLNI
jgi:DNA helicase-2/ATP-dependent DNA helicase PcrA